MKLRNLGKSITRLHGVVASTGLRLGSELCCLGGARDGEPLTDAQSKGISTRVGGEEGAERDSIGFRNFGQSIATLDTVSTWSVRSDVLAGLSIPAMGHNRTVRHNHHLLR